MTGGRVCVVWRPDRICDVKAEEGYSGNGTVGSKARRTRDSAWAFFLAAQQATGGDDDFLSLDWNILPALDKGDLHSVDSTERSIKTHHDSPPTTASPEYLQYTGRHRQKVPKHKLRSPLLEGFQRQRYCTHGLPLQASCAMIIPQDATPGDCLPQP
jgi:hypothetical protein